VDPFIIVGNASPIYVFVSFADYGWSSQVGLDSRSPSTGMFSKNKGILQWMDVNVRIRKSIATLYPISE
jgi:hypothetical protein